MAAAGRAMAPASLIWSPDLSKGMYDGKFLEFLGKDRVFKACLEGSNDISKLGEKIDELMEKESNKMDCILTASACVQLFTQLNFTGPNINITSLVSDTLNSAACEELVINGEDVSSSTQGAFLLLCATKLLQKEQKDDVEFYRAWWGGRCAKLHQKIIVTNVQPLQSFATKCWEKVQKMIEEKKSPKHLNDKELAKAYLEAAESFWVYYKYKKSQECLDKALEITNATFKVSGALGKRTKYQQESKVQLMIKLESAKDSIQNEALEANYWKKKIEIIHALTMDEKEKSTKSEGKEEMKSTHVEKKEDEKKDKKEGNKNPYEKIFPQMAENTSDYLLDHVKFDDEKTSNAGSTRLDRANLLLRAIHKKKITMIGDAVGMHEAVEYVKTAMSLSPGHESGERSWAITYACLYYRAMWEAGDQEMSIRSLSQLEILKYIHDEKINDAKVDISLLRLNDAHIAAIPPIWEIRSSLAGGYIKMNMLQSALEEYLKLEAWPEVIRVSILLGRKSNAETLLKKQLNEIKTDEKGKYKSKAQRRLVARMYSYLGMVQNDPKLFEKAWEISEKSYPKAKRLIANYHYDRLEWKECIGHFTDALIVNPVHVDSWYKQGVAAMECKDWTIAKNSFSRVVSLDREHGFAWNNLAAVNLHMQNHKEALGSLEFAVKFKRNDWKVWENYLTTALHLKELSKACQALKQTVDIRRKEAIDEKIIDLMTRETVRQTLPLLKNYHKPKNAKQRDEVLRKIGLGPGSVFQLYLKCLNNCTQHVSHPALWKARAELSELIFDYKEAVEFRQNQLKGLQVDGWEDAEKSAIDVLKAATSLGKCYKEMKDETSGRLMAERLISRIEKSENLENGGTVQKFLKELREAVGSSTKAAESTTETKEEESSAIPDYLADWA